MGGGIIIYYEKKIVNQEYQWPKWPIWFENAEEHIREVVDSNRWTIRGGWTGTKTKEEEFCRLFSKFNNCRHTVLTTSGSTALVLALEALGIGPGDEVVVPALTWFAPVVAILNVGAIPILADVDVNSTCIEPSHIEKSISDKTKAIIVVHLHCSVANMDRIMEIATQNNIKVIEDCSQAHGAQYKTKNVGTIGDIGVFSFNQEKVLTCGEGGAVVTNSEEYYERIFRLKTDGCFFNPHQKEYGQDQLIYDSKFMGYNACITEFQTAVLLSQFREFERLNLIREENGKYLDSQISNIEGLTPIIRSEEETKRTYYEYGFFVDDKILERKSIEEIGKHLSEKLGFPIHPTDEPVYRNKLFSPATRARYSQSINNNRYKRIQECNFNNAELISRKLLVFHHSILLSPREKLQEIINCLNELDYFIK